MNIISSHLVLNGCILTSTEGCFWSTNFKITQMKSLSNGLKEYGILTEHTDTIDWQNARTQLTESHTDSLTTSVIVDFDDFDYQYRNSHDCEEVKLVRAHLEHFHHQGRGGGGADPVGKTTPQPVSKG